MGVAKDQRAPGANIINVLAAVCVPDPGPAATRYEEWVPADGLEGAYGAINTSGQYGIGSLEQRPRVLARAAGYW
jgi:hypothetical protein